MASSLQSLNTPCMNLQQPSLRASSLDHPFVVRNPLSALLSHVKLPLQFTIFITFIISFRSVPSPHHSNKVLTTTKQAEPLQLCLCIILLFFSFSLLFTPPLGRINPNNHSPNQGRINLISDYLSQRRVVCVCLDCLECLECL